MGIIADVHIDLLPEAENHLDTFLAAMKKEQPDALIQLGDFAFPSDKNQRLVDKFNSAHPDAIHVIGNHDLDKGHTKDDVVKSWGIPGYYYSKEVEGLKLIVLDGNDKGSPTYSQHGGYHCYIGEEQRSWLKSELENSTKPVILVSHQPLAGVATVDNGKQMQKLLSPYKEKILVCLNGHTHVDQHAVVDGINYIHINSASYYWLGGKVRLAPYKDALFTTLSIDPDKGTLEITESKSTWSKGTPADAGYFNNGKNSHRKGLVHPQISAREVAT